MERELDYAKADPRRQQTRRRQRSIQVLKVLRAYSAAGALTTPSHLRDGVDLLLLDHESRSNEEALDLALPDDRLIAAALDFRETLPDQHVIVVSDDFGPWHKARRYGLDRRELPLGERRPHPKAAAKVVSSEQVI